MFAQVPLPDFSAFAESAVPTSPFVDDLPPLPLQVRPVVLPQTIGPGALAPQTAAPQPPALPHRGLDVASLIGPLFGLGAAIGGGSQIGAGALAGVNQQRAAQEAHALRQQQLDLQRQQEARLQAEQERIRKAQEAATIAAEQAREAARQRAVASYVLDVSKSARQFRTKDEHDAFVRQADAMGVESYGLRPGAMISAIPFIPSPTKDRAQQVLERYRKLAPDGALTTGAKGSRVPLSRISVQFDVDGDGVDENIPYAQLEELAGQAFYGPNGERVEGRTSQPVPTYGETFGAARGTALADKPLPIGSNGAPDYGRALRDLRAMNPTGRSSTASDRRQARADAQTQVRDRLYESILNGDGDDALRQTFAATMSGIGLSYRAEVARIRKEILTAGEHGLPVDERELMSTEDIVARGRNVLTGSSSRPGPAPATAPSGGRGAAPKPAGARLPRRDPASVSQTEMHAAARQVLDEARRQSGDTRPVTDADVTALLSRPQNERAIRIKLAGGGQ